jgi:hypothetical protein
LAVDALLAFLAVDALLAFLAVLAFAARRFGFAAGNAAVFGVTAAAGAAVCGLAARLVVRRLVVRLVAFGLAVRVLAVLRAAGRDVRVDPELVAIIRRTASVAAVTIAAPIFPALSAAYSAPSSASRPAFFALLRTFSFVDSAAAAATRPAASMLRASGFCANSASLSVAAPTLLLPDLFPVLPSDDFAIAVSYAFVTEP